MKPVICQNRISEKAKETSNYFTQAEELIDKLENRSLLNLGNQYLLILSSKRISSTGKMAKFDEIILKLKNIISKLESICG